MRYVCKRCNGKGRIYRGIFECPACTGNCFFDIDDEVENCASCEGTGRKLMLFSCDLCGGKGFSIKLEKIGNAETVPKEKALPQEKTETNQAVEFEEFGEEKTEAPESTVKVKEKPITENKGPSAKKEKTIKKRLKKIRKLRTRSKRKLKAAPKKKKKR